MSRRGRRRILNAGTAITGETSNVVTEDTNADSAYTACFYEASIISLP